MLVFTSVYLVAIIIPVFAYYFAEGNTNLVWHKNILEKCGQKKLDSAFKRQGIYLYGFIGTGYGGYIGCVFNKFRI